MYDDWKSILVPFSILLASSTAGMLLVNYIFEAFSLDSSSLFGGASALIGVIALTILICYAISVLILPKPLLLYFMPEPELSMTSEDALEQARNVIAKHGMEAHLYIPSAGYRDDQELSAALDTLSAAGFIMTDNKEQLVGKVASRLSSNEIAAQRRAEFRVVETGE